MHETIHKIYHDIPGVNEMVGPPAASTANMPANWKKSVEKAPVACSAETNTTPNLRCRYILLLLQRLWTGCRIETYLHNSSWDTFP